jgi:hypothetical protein
MLQELVEPPQLIVIRAGCTAKVADLGMDVGDHDPLPIVPVNVGDAPAADVTQVAVTADAMALFGRILINHAVPPA